MKKIMIVVVALLFLGGGGVGAYLYFTKPAEAATAEGEAGDKATKVAQKEKKDVDKSKYVFVELDPLILPIIDEGGVTQTVSLVIAIEVADDKIAANVTGQAPRLKDAYIQDMYGALNKKSALKDGVIQVNMLKERLNKVSAQVLGDDVVQDVLLQVVQQRPV